MREQVFARGFGRFQLLCSNSTLNIQRACVSTTIKLTEASICPFQKTTVSSTVCVQLALSYHGRALYHVCCAIWVDTTLQALEEAHFYPCDKY